MPRKPVVQDKEEAKISAASEAAARRSKKKGEKGKTKWYIMVGIGGVLCLLTIFLALSGPSAKKKGGNPRLEAYVNDQLRDVNARTEGNFTAAASPFFNKWTVGDVKWGHAGISVSNMLGISGAVQVCSFDDGVEGGAIPPAYDARDNWADCFPQVRDSGNCSASYAIAAAEVISARYCIGDFAKYSSVRLSPQQILSCDKKSRGCKGGGIDSVWSYIQRRGLYPEECVPYAGEKGAQCKTECKDEQKLRVLDHCVLTQEKAIKREIYNRGPVVAPLYLKDEYLLYSSGLYYPTEGNEQMFDGVGEPIMHAVMVLGWGKSQGTPYWIVRHSWGPGWGENGYAKVAAGSILRDSYIVTGTPATEENVQAAEQKKLEEEQRKEEAKKERAARDERIAEQRKKMEAEKAASQAEEDDPDLELDDEDIEQEVDLDDDDAV